MSIDKIKKQIEDLEKGLTNDNVPEKFKDNMRKKMEELQTSLQEIQKAEAEEEKKEEKEEKEDKKDTPPSKKKILSQEDKDTCKALISRLKGLLNEFDESPAKKAKASKPVVKKKTSTILIEGVVNTVSRAVKREMTADKVNGIDVEHLKTAEKEFVAAFKSIKKALVGISSDTMIDKFTDMFDQLIKEVQDKQKEIKDKN